jgi:hypothetical protein
LEQIGQKMKDISRSKAAMYLGEGRRTNRSANRKKGKLSDEGGTGKTGQRRLATKWYERRTHATHGPLIASTVISPDHPEK